MWTEELKERNAWILERPSQAQGANIEPNVIRVNQFMLEDKTGKKI